MADEERPEAWVIAPDFFGPTPMAGALPEGLRLGDLIILDDQMYEVTTLTDTEAVLTPVIRGPVDG